MVGVLYTKEMTDPVFIPYIPNALSSAWSIVDNKHLLIDHFLS